MANTKLRKAQIIGIDATQVADGSVSNTEFQYINTLSSNAQDQLNAKQATLSGASLTGVTVATDDKVLIQDTSDSDNLKTVTAQSIADLGGGSPASPDTSLQFNDGGSFGGAEILYTEGVGTTTLTFTKELDHNLQVATSTTTDANGGNLLVGAGEADGDGNGGDLILAPGIISGGGNKGRIVFPEDQYWGAVEIVGADATVTNGGGLTISMSAGVGDGSGGGGSFLLNAGNGGVTGSAGGVTIAAGNAGGGDGNGGNIQLILGAKQGAGSNGALYIAPKGNPGINAILDFDSIATSNKTFTFPNTSGTIALTTSTVAVATAVTVANEATDTTCFINFTTAVTGDLGVKSNTNMTFNSNTGVATFASTVLTTTDINGGTVDGAIIGGSSAAAGTFTTAVANSFVPNSATIPSNGLYLPAGNTLGFAINSAAELQLTGTALSPAADGGSSLGTTALGWQNLFGNTGFVLNIENSDWVATHTAGILTVGTGDLRVTNAGANSASVVTVGGSQTLTSKTLTSPTLTTPSAFTTGGTITLAENTSIALDPAGSADGKYTGITVTGTAGYTQAFGDLVYLDPTDSRWEACDANAAAGADGDSRGIIGMVVSAGTDGNACTILLVGIIRADAKFPSFTINNPIYVSETAGAVTQTQPTTTDVVIRVVGSALTADEMYFNPDFAYITHT